MKIGFIRYPQKLYTSGKVLRGGSEIANQYIIDWLREHNVEVVDFMPESDERINLMNVSALGTPLMFQDLIKQIEKINECDLIFTTNWFGAILPEIKKPIITIFHSNASLVLDSIKDENIEDKELLEKWLDIAKDFNIGQKSNQSKHEMVITLGEAYFAQNSTKIIAVSDLLKNSLVDYYQADSGKITVINNTYSRDWDSIDLSKKTFDGELKLINVTRLPMDYNGFVGKGTYRILEVLNRVNDLPKIVLASTNPGLFEPILSRHTEKVELVENADRMTVGRKLAEAHISIHCSRCEACQLTLIEEMLMKTVPITFNVGVAGELIENGVNGFIVNSVDEMIEKIYYLNNNRKEASLMAENARKTILDKLSIDKIGQKYLELIRSFG